MMTQNKQELNATLCVCVCDKKISKILEEIDSYSDIS